MAASYQLHITNSKMQDKLGALNGKDKCLDALVFSAFWELERSPKFNVSEKYVVKIKKIDDTSGKTKTTTLVNLRLNYRDLIAFLQCMHTIFRNERML